MLRNDNDVARMSIQVISQILPRFRRKIFIPLMLFAIIGHINAQSVPTITSCSHSGYYFDAVTNQCLICPAGKI